MAIGIGDSVPSVTLRTKTENGIEEITTSEIFSDKTVALFAVPGAFTPTCSAKHLPSYMDNAAALKEKGVDTIACVSVNDAFVMDAWAKDQNVGDSILMLADGNSEFTASIDLGMDGSAFGLGYRSQRFSMVVKNGVVEHINIEEPGQFEKSSAETMLGQL